MIVVRRQRDWPAGLDDRLAAVRRSGDRRLVLERYGDRREVGLGPADPFGNCLKAIAVPIRFDGLGGVEVCLVAGAGERDVGALACGVGGDDQVGGVGREALGGKWVLDVGEAELRGVP